MTLPVVETRNVSRVFPMAAAPVTALQDVSLRIDATDYVGAVKDASADWFKGWTCNATYVTFDDASNAGRSCTSLPTS